MMFYTEGEKAVAGMEYQGGLKRYPHSPHCCHYLTYPNSALLSSSKCARARTVPGVGMYKEVNQRQWIKERRKALGMKVGDLATAMNMTLNQFNNRLYNDYFFNADQLRQLASILGDS